MTNKKTSAKGDVNEAQDAELEATHALELLAVAVGEPPKSSLKAILAGTTDADLVSVGKTILSSRIVTDAARIYRKAWDFYRQATEEQKRRLRGFSKPLLALAVQQALALEKLDRQRATTNTSAGIARAGQDKASEAAQSRAIELRDQAYDALRDASGRDETLRAQVDAAFGTAATSETLAGGLEQTAKLLRRWLKGGEEALTARLELASLDEPYAKELEAAARELRVAVADATNRPVDAKVTQGALDRADGINILLMGQIIRAFDGAHGIDPTIPRLVPISTRRLFNRNTRKKAEAAEPPRAGSDATPSGAGVELIDG
ncbi:hypothetical protein [Sorangium sp. So ce426]|uniref:hypothetical protein n=1 Tax=Sorangium sp. So ce426 TaxID=3133312 RepID=UPI003F5BEEAA